MDIIQLILLGIIGWGLHDLIKYMKVNRVRLVMTDENDNVVPDTTQEVKEEVVLNRYIPNVNSWDEVNQLLASIGAVVILTEDKTLEDVGHNPDFWRLLGDTDAKGTFK